MLKKYFKNLSGSFKFFSLVLFLYFVLFLINFNLGVEVFKNFSQMFLKIIPLLGFVLVLMIMVDLVFTKERTTKYLGKNCGWKSYFYAVIGGIFLTGPPYIQYPMLGKLKERGISNSILAVLLFNRNVKPAFFPALIFYFGFEYTLIFSFYIIFFSLFNGFLVGKLTKEN